MLQNKVLRTLVASKAVRVNAGYTDIPNSHPLVQKSFTEDEWDAIKELGVSLGVDMGDSGVTFCIQSKEGSRRILEPMIGLDSDSHELVVKWGKEVVSLDPSLIEDVDLAGEGNRLVVYFSHSDLTLEGWAAESLSRKEIKAALKAGQPQALFGYLRTGSPFAKLSQLDPGEYAVVGITQGEAFGRETYYLAVKVGSQVKSVRANSALNATIAGLDYSGVSEDNPATLTVFPIEEYTNLGHPIVPTSLALPYTGGEVFDFLN